MHRQSVAIILSSDGTKKERPEPSVRLVPLLFTPAKILGAYGDGGAASLRDDDTLAHKMKMIANHGQQKRYYHEMVGCNSRLDSIQAAILNIKLQKLDQYSNARQFKWLLFMIKLLQVIEKIQRRYVASYSNHVYHQYTFVLENADRDGLNAYL